MPGPGTWSAGDVLTAADLNAIGVWSTYTPTLAQNATLTCTVNLAEYVQINKMVIVNVDLTCTTTGTAGQIITVTLPVTATTTPGGGFQRTIGSGAFLDSSATDVMLVNVCTDSSTRVRFATEATTSTVSGLGANPSVALGANDVISFSVMYQAA